MADALEEHDGKISLGSKNITNLQLANDIDALAEEQQELEALVESFNKTCTKYKIEISAEKTKLMTNKPERDQDEMTDAGDRSQLQEPRSSCFKWLKTRDSFKDCASHCSSYKAVAYLEQ